MNKEKRIIVCDGSLVPSVHFKNDNKCSKPKILILGSHITEKSLEAGFFYMNVGRSFWKILSTLLDNQELKRRANDYDDLFLAIKNNKKSKTKETLNDIKKDIVRILNENNVAIADIIAYCVCTSASNKDIIEETTMPNKELNELLRETDVVLINGRSKDRCGNPSKKSEKYFFDKFGFKHDRVKCVISSSGAAFGSIQCKANEWKNAVDELMANK